MANHSGSDFQIEGSGTSRLGDDARPLAVIELGSMHVVAVSDEATELLGTSADHIVGKGVLDLIAPAERPLAQAALNLLASHAMVGYHGTRTFLRGDGDTICLRFSVWVESSEPAVALLALHAMDAAGFPWPLTGTDFKIALAITDHDWIIEHVSSDIEEILGQAPVSYEGVSVLGGIGETRRSW
jgi:PAS domain S-box-containing protein